MARSRLLGESKTPRGGAERTIQRSGSQDVKRQDALSGLLELPEGADRTERARVFAGAVTEIKRRVRPVLQNRGIARAFLFGSVARGDARRRSDIDIAVELPRDSTMDLIGFADLALELEAALGRRVDLVNSATMKPRIRERVEMEQVSLL